MATIERTVDGVLRRRWDGGAGVFTAWDAAGNLTESRPLTPDEVTVLGARADAAQATAARQQLLDAANAARTGNDAFLAVDTPTAAEVVAQVRALTRQNNALIRLAADDLGGLA